MLHARRQSAIALAAALAGFAAEPLFAADDHGHAAAGAQTAQDLKNADAPVSVSADDAIKMLADGNARYVADAVQRPNLGQARRCDTFANGQHPYAAVLACADSRVPVEYVFDAGVGDLFVVRVAGNVADADEIGTLEYGVEHLGINAIVVLGHVKCGAVTAVVDKADVTPNIAKLVDNIVPAAEAARKQFPQLAGPRLVTQAIRLNVQRAMADLTANSELLAKRVKDGRLKVVGGVYDLHSGEVDWLGQPPTSTAVMSAPARDDAAAAAAPAERRVKEPAGERRHTSAHEPSATPKSAPATESAKKPATDDGHKHAKAEPEKKPADESAAAQAPAATAPKKDNWFAFGALLAASSVLSAFLIRFTSGRSRPQPEGPAPASAAAAAS